MRRLPINRLRPSATAFVVAAVVTAFDLATKAWARAALENSNRHLVGPINLKLTFNSGFGFSLGRGAPVVSAVMSIAVIAVVAVAAAFAHAGWPAVGFGLILGGGVSNLIDRLTSTMNGVTDYVSVGAFPVFNLADASITVGVVILIVVALMGRPLLAER